MFIQLFMQFLCFIELLLRKSICQLNYEALVTFSFPASCLGWVYIYIFFWFFTRSRFVYETCFNDKRQLQHPTLAAAAAAATWCCWLKCWPTLHALIAVWNCFFINV